VAAGFEHALAVKTDGTLWSWAQNSNGQLGLGDTITRSSPVQIGALSGWSQVSAGSSISAAIKTDGTLWTWGLNTSGQCGLGDVVRRSSPVQVGALTDWSQVQPVGSGAMVAVKTDGTLWAWGANAVGVLGQGDVISRSSPVQVGALSNWSQVSGGPNFVLAVKTDGTLWSWGTNGSGQLGLGDVVARSSPVQVGALSNWSKVAGATSNGVHSLAIKTDGTLWAWGNNANGRLGDGTTVNVSSPVQIGLSTNFSKVSAGDNFSLGIAT